MRYLVRSELATTDECARTYETSETVLPDLLDTLFRLMYFTQEQEPGQEDGLNYFVIKRCIYLPEAFAQRGCRRSR